VRRYFTAEDPVGKQIRFEGDEEAVEIVGVVSDVKPFDPSVPPEPGVYWSNLQRPRLGNYLVLRVTGETSVVQKAIEGAIQRVDSEIQVSAARTIEEIVARRLVPARFRTFLIAAFALIALALAAAGLFGLLAYSVTLRLPEFGVRIALGARPAQLLRSVVGEGMRLTGIGLALGIGAAVWLSRLMTGLLRGVTATDPLAYAAAALVLVSVALVATVFPALRATRVQPMSALRAE
jgi:putative ABC transport system permease protein